MPLRTCIRFLCVCIAALASLSCQIGDNGDSGKGSGDNPPATVNFFNESSFKVDIYKNLNPANFDPTTLVCTVNAGSTYKASIYASSD